jgi:hypothetical protein
MQEILSSGVEGVALADSLDCEHTSSQDSILANSLVRIVGTRRPKPAGWRQPGRDQPLVESKNGQDDYLKGFQLFCSSNGQISQENLK